MQLYFREYLSGRPLAVDPVEVLRVEPLEPTEAAMGLAGARLVINDADALLVRGTWEHVYARYLAGLSVDADIAALGEDLDADIEALGLLIDSVAEYTDASGYGPVFVQEGGGVTAAMTAPDGFRYSRVGNLVTITGVLAVSTVGALGTNQGLIGTFTLPATSLDRACGGGFNTTNADPSDVSPTLGILVLPGGAVASVALHSAVGADFEVEYGISLTIRIS